MGTQQVQQMLWAVVWMELYCQLHQWVDHMFWRVFVDTKLASRHMKGASHLQKRLGSCANMKFALIQTICTRLKRKCSFSSMHWLSLSTVYGISWCLVFTTTIVEYGCSTRFIRWWWSVMHVRGQLNWGSSKMPRRFRCSTIPVENCLRLLLALNKGMLCSPRECFML